MTKALLTLISFSLFTIPSFGDGILIAMGESTSKEHPKSKRLSYIYETKIKLFEDQSSSLTIDIEASYFNWQNNYGPDIDVGAITPYLRYKIDWGTISYFASLGIGVAYTEETRWHNRKLGDNWLFEDKLEAGIELYNTHRISAVLRHYSNADLNNNNDGTNVLSFNYSYHW